MSILIAPITVNGSDYCPNTGNYSYTIGKEWRTQSFLTSDASATTFDDHGISVGETLTPNDSENRWTICSSNSSASNGSVEFGCICPTSIDFRFRYDRDADVVSGVNNVACSIFLNGVETQLTLDKLNRSNPSLTSLNYTLPLTPNACGNIIKIEGSTQINDEYIYVEITQVT